MRPTVKSNPARSNLSRSCVSVRNFAVYCKLNLFDTTRGGTILEVNRQLYVLTGDTRTKQMSQCPMSFRNLADEAIKYD